MNSLGQSFDVFKLLIAAVIAIVILSVLMSIISQIIIPNDSPPAGAGRLIESLKSSTLSVMSSEPVTFKNNDSINRFNLAQDRGILPDQICLSAGVFEDDEDLWVASDSLSTITYKGSTNQKVKLRGICGIAATITNNEILNDDPLLEEGWFDGCECLDDEEGKECCLIAVVRV